MFGFFGGGGPHGGVFEQHYRAMPVAFIDKQSAEFGDKVILPPSALDRLASLHIEYPMLFRVESVATGRVTHCGVLEFVAEEGVVYMPHWMMQNMLLQVGDMVKFRNVSLPKGTYVKLQPVTSDFLDISNPKAVLERTLRSYTCLTVGDCFVVNYNNKNYEIEVREAKPGQAISVVETDCQVDFEAPKDYKEPEKVFRDPPAAKAAAKPADDKASAGSSSKPADAAPAEPEQPAFLAFAGTARRLDGKAVSTTSQPVPVPVVSNSRTGASLIAAASAGTSTAAPSTSGPKAGTFVSTGNRLLDKLEREKAQKSGGGAAPPPPAAAAPKPAEEKKPEDDSAAGFKAFQGKGNRLK